jgi:hypothetical protein
MEEFFPLLPRYHDFDNGIAAHVAQSAEHILGKDEVTGSIPVMGSRDR